LGSEHHQQSCTLSLSDYHRPLIQKEEIYDKLFHNTTVSQTKQEKDLSSLKKNIPISLFSSNWKQRTEKNEK
jgi:hypothetical protein